MVVVVVVLVMVVLVVLVVPVVVVLVVVVLLLVVVLVVVVLVVVVVVGGGGGGGGGWWLVCFSVFSLRVSVSFFLAALNAHTSEQHAKATAHGSSLLATVAGLEDWRAHVFVIESII